ncbi:aminotransferase class I/II-fold pyridoxal phosphate-dependent enzyme [Rhodococcus sp. D2-41]|uniref:MalY/PatB family protein n=1 Tax=Speluncibacter jeojiensis TaxID=2710754 RepID=UPI00240FAF74|nr:aminotransferase class I/II-fold pyridoxal phosphate-dependent enzyme [Rhodococcus sp. D2-41]MDG3012640.1 aminotransferase class I/II-fold pyridoxal phosphate-dependent enzyme [Rhodococcus sp. D2-41]
MTFDDITAECLRAAGGMKWTKHPGMLGAFVAEMDFGVAPAIARSLHDAVDRGLVGYTPPWLEEEVSASTSEWLSVRYGWQVAADGILPTSDVIHAFEIVLSRIAPPDAQVVLMTPAYGPFFMLSAILGRKVIEVPMLRDGGSWQVDLAGLDAAFRQGGGVLVLCHPHNPIGKVYTPTELADIAGVVAAHDGLVFADEIHAPLTFDGVPHVPYASVNETAAGHALTATSASKAFNLAGLKCAQLILTADGHRARLNPLREYVSHGCAVLGAIATVAAYRDGADWLGEVLGYLAGNRDAALELIGELAPGIDATRPAATYFSWLDMRGLGIENPQKFFMKHAGVALSDGSTFGAVGAGHVRLNLAMPRPLLRDAITAMGAAIGG